MALDVEVIEFLKPNATTGNQTVTTAFLPKAIRIWGEHLNSSNTIQSTHSEFSFGFSDGVNDRCIGMVREDGVASADTKRQVRNDACVLFLDIAGGIDGQANIDSFNATSFVINWTVNTTSTQTRVKAIVFGGADITGVQVGDFALNTVTGS